MSWAFNLSRLRFLFKIIDKTGGSPRIYSKKKRKLDVKEFKKQAHEFKGFDASSVEQIAKLAIIMWTIPSMGSFKSIRTIKMG